MSIDEAMGFFKALIPQILEKGGQKLPTEKLSTFNFQLSTYEYAIVKKSSSKSLRVSRSLKMSASRT